MCTWLTELSYRCIAYPHKTEKSDFGVGFPDFPGWVTAEKALQEARKFAAEALALHIQGVMEQKTRTWGTRLCNSKGSRLREGRG